MDNKNYYIKSILKTLGIGIAAIIAAIVIFGAPEGEAIFGAVVFAGVPFGWPIMKNICSGIMAFGFVGILIYFIVMLVLSALVGWIIMVIRLVKDLFCLGKLIYTEKMENKTVV